DKETDPDPLSRAGGPLDGADGPDGGEDEDEGNGVDDAGDEEGQAVAVFLHGPAHEGVEKGRPEGPRGAQEPFHRSDDPGREEVRRQGLDVGRPELVAEEGE